MPPRPPTVDSDAALDRALARGVLCRILRLGLEPPALGTLPGLFSAESRNAAALAGQILEDGTSGALTAAVAGLTALSRPRLGTLRGRYEALFGHTLRGRVCPYEGEYGQQAMLQQAHELADLGGFYRAFGLIPAAGRRERPDHVACEVEFYGFLALKQAHALEVADGGMLELTRQAGRTFLRRHLGRFGRAFAVALQDAAGDGLYARIGCLLQAFVELECRRLEVPPGPRVLELSAVAESGVPMACGSEGSEELVPLGGAR